MYKQKLSCLINLWKEARNWRVLIHSIFVCKNSKYWNCKELCDQECSARGVTILWAAANVIARTVPRQSQYKSNPIWENQESGQRWNKLLRMIMLWCRQSLFEVLLQFCNLRFEHQFLSYDFFGIDTLRWT